MELKICHLYPDALNLYGDRGNLICMVKRLEWRGICAAVSELPVGQAENLSQFDLFFIGGGQDFEQELLRKDLMGKKSADLAAAIADGKTVLAICGGYQILGQYYLTAGGVQLDYLGIADFYTVGDRERLIGNYSYRCGQESGGSIVMGFENHSGKTWLGKESKPLGTVLWGHGNNGADGTEGVRYLNIFGTYSHGPVLPKNPAFCDYILQTALIRKYGSAVLPPLDDAEEKAARDAFPQKKKPNRLRKSMVQGGLHV